MIRTFFRDGLAWVAVFGAILGAAIWFSSPARADVLDSVTICTVLDEYPAADRVYGVGLNTPCPEHLPEVLAFARSVDRGVAA